MRLAILRQTPTISPEEPKFKKAKKVLTSSDPNYRDKLVKITETLSQLPPNEKFFSIDEFGPFSVKI